MRESSIKVTQRLDYERNICIFLVNIIDRIMNCEIKLGNVYYLVCFLFCKKLYMHQIVLRDMLDYKHNVFNFNQ